MSNTRLLVTLIVLLLVLVSACTEKQEVASGQGVESKTALDQDPEGGHFPLSFVDSAGRSIVLSSSPGRFVVLGKIGHGPYMAAHLLYMFPETASRLVGLEERERSSHFLALIDPRFSEKKLLDINAGSEQIAALRPDAVFMKGTVADSSTTVLDQVNIPMIYLGLEDPEQFLCDVSLVGDILDNKARAEEVVSFYRSRTGMMHDRLQGIGEEDKPRVLVLGYNSRGGTAAIQVPAVSWMQTLQAAIAGGRPVWTEETGTTNGWTVVSFEQIAAWDPDKVFITAWYRENPLKVTNRLKTDPQWSKLKAVENGEIYAYPCDLFPWDTPGPRWILGCMWLATQTHPDLFGDIDMKEQVYLFFEELFFMPRQRVDEEIMPMILKTAGSSIHD